MTLTKKIALPTPTPPPHKSEGKGNEAARKYYLEKVTDGLVFDGEGKDKYEALVTQMIESCPSKDTKLNFMFNTISKCYDEMKPWAHAESGSASGIERLVVRFLRMEFKKPVGWNLPPDLAGIDIRRLREASYRREITEKDWQCSSQASAKPVAPPAVASLGMPADASFERGSLLNPRPGASTRPTPAFKSSALGSPAYAGSAPVSARSTPYGSAVSGRVSTQSTRSFGSSAMSFASSTESLPDAQLKQEWIDTRSGVSVAFTATLKGFFGDASDGVTRDVIFSTLTSSDTKAAFVENLFGFLGAENNGIIESDLEGLPIQKDTVKLAIILMLLRLHFDLPLKEEVGFADSILARIAATEMTVDSYFSALAKDVSGYRKSFSEWCWQTKIEVAAKAEPKPVRKGPPAAGAVKPSAKRAVVGIEFSKFATLDFNTLADLPMQAILRSLSVIEGPDAPKAGGRKKPLRVGLGNGGNECFANSTFQVMANQRFLEYLLNLTPRQLAPRGAEPSLKEKVNNLICLTLFIAYLISGEPKHLAPLFPAAVSPDTMVHLAKRYLLKAASANGVISFSNGRQHCSQEFWIQLTSACGAEITSTLKSELTGVAPKKGAKSTHLMDKSKLPQTSVRREPIAIIDVPLGSATVEAGVRKYFGKEQFVEKEQPGVDGYMANFVYTHKQLSLEVAADTLMLCNRKFKEIPAGGASKMTPYHVGVNEFIEVVVAGEPVRYRLTGFSCHAGSFPTSGHYVAMCRNLEGQGWNLVNDSYSDPATSDQIAFKDNQLVCKDKGLSRFTPYLLMYERVS